jgi:hypothetical protein
MSPTETPVFFVRYRQGRGGRVRRLGEFLRRAAAVEAADTLKWIGGYFDVQVVARRGLVQPVRTRSR